MKNFTIGVFIIILSQNLYCQSLKRQQISNLSALGKVWGFLKYYHPIVSQGKYNWDTALVANYYKTINCNNKTAFNKLMGSIINSAGASTKFNITRTSKRKPIILPNQLEWISDSSTFTSEITHVLQNIYLSYKPVDNFYIKRVPVVGNAEFPNEYEYPVIFPSPEYRFLALCRFWNVINYYYPYKSLIPVKWESVLYDFIPRMYNMQTEYAYYRTVQEMLTLLNDGHAIVKSNWGNQFSDRKFLPFIIEKPDSVYIVGKCLEPIICRRGDIATGDTITHIDEMDVKTLFKHHARYQSASNENYRLFKSLQWMPIVKNEMVDVNFKKGFDTITKTIPTQQTPYIIRTRYIETLKLLNDSVGYLHVGKLVASEIDKIFSQLDTIKYLIADCRNYPKWTLMAIAEKILPQQTIIALVCEPDYRNPGEIKWVVPMYAGKRNENPYKGKIIVLINEETMSQSELTVLVFKNAPGCITIGRQTAGAIGDVSILPLPGNLKINYSGLGYYLPDKNLLQQTGIQPNITVKLTYKGIIEDRDEILERALEYIKTGN